MSKIWSAKVTDSDIVFSQNGYTLSVPLAVAGKWLVENIDHSCGGCIDLPTQGFFKSNKYSWCNLSREIASFYDKGIEWVLTETEKASKYGSFDLTVVRELNDFFKKFPLAPGPHDDSYYVGYNDPDFGCVESWVDFNLVEYKPWGKEFLKMWNEMKDRVLFTGQLFGLETFREFYIDGELVKISDRVARGYRFDTPVTVLEMLKSAYHVLYDPENLATDTQGVIGSVNIKKRSKIPTLEFWFTDS